MHSAHQRTQHLELVPMTREQALEMVDALSAEDRAQVSPEWLARLHSTKPPDPWSLGFSILERSGGAIVGQCSFKGPPSVQGMVEIAYGINPEHRGKGYATEAAEALAAWAFEDPRVRSVWAHTLPELNASTRVLEKCAFRWIGEVEDPEDGLVWRWELTRKRK